MPTILVNEIPKKTLEPGKHSTFVSAFNPVLFRLTRADFLYTSVAFDPSGNLILYCTTDPSDIEVGSFVFIKDQLVPSTKGPRKVIAVSPTTITLEGPFAAASTGYVLADQLYPSIHLEVKIETYELPSFILEGELTRRVYFSDPEGLFRIDISSYLSSRFSAKNFFQYDEVNYRDKEVSYSFRVSYRLKWTGNEDGPFIEIPEFFYATSSAFQVGHPYDGNLLEYTTQIEPELSDVNKAAKFLSGFDRPTYFPGYPFDLGFIYNVCTGATPIKRVLERKDLNGVGGGGNNETVLNSNNRAGVNRLTLDSVYVEAADSRYVDVWIESGLPNSARYVDPDYVDDLYVTP